ncbi:MAG: mechanosensitive ion channel [Giesbergeria sp.]|jgi:small-conductance mechanosensitive channel|nr:mechanosensitive ion channel [Giesbergeria sp.]
MRRSLTLYLPDWAQDWLEIIVPGVQIAFILLTAWLLQHLLGRLLTRAGRHYQIPLELQMPIHGLMRWTILAAALLLVLERLGVSATVLWTGFTGFATVGAVAFFAAWSVLSNLFCAFLIFTMGPFRLGDTIELLDTAEKPGAKGRVVDINLLYTTLEDGSEGHGGALLQIPNTLIFQRVLRRWEPGAAPADSPAPATDSTPPAPAQSTPAVP